MNAHDLAATYHMLSVDEVDLIQECVKSLPPNIIAVNIGANIGTSTCAILEANPVAKVYSIDRKEYPEERRNLIACGLNPDAVVRILGDSRRIQFTEPIDLVFVDGGHDDETVNSDIDKFKPLCRHIMLFHDYDHPNYRGTNTHLTQIVDRRMADWERIGQARYLVAFRRRLEDLQTA